MQPPRRTHDAAELLAERAWLRRLAVRLVGEHDADDLLQETWLAARVRGADDVRRIGPWLAGILRHLARGLERARGRRRGREARASRPERLPSTLDLVERVDTEQRLARAVLALDEPYRTALLLRFHEGLTSAEIARRQGVPEGTVRWRVKHGLDRLRAGLEGELGDGHGLRAALAALVRSGGGTATLAGAALMSTSKALAVGTLVVVAALAVWRATRELAAPRGSGVPAAGARAALRLPADLPEHDGAALVTAATGRTADTSRHAAAEPELTRLRVLEWDGRPNAERNVVLAALAGETRPLARLADAEGRVEFPASGERRALVVERAGAFPYRGELALVPGEETLRLPAPAGAELTGRVLVDGVAPPRPLWLLLHAASSADVSVDTSNVACLLAGDVTWVDTDAQGRFRFRGLLPDADLNLRVPEGYAREGTRARSDPGAGAVFHFEGPAEGVVIALERHASVRGRVVAADGVTPVARARVELDLADGRFGRETGPDGGFEVFTREPARSARVRIGSPSAEHGLGASLDGPVLDLDFAEPRLHQDLGDLALSPRGGLQIQVRSRGGAPLEGAELGVVTAWPEHVTDAAGEAWVDGLAPGDELAVTLRAHRTAFVVLPDPLPPSLAVVLEDSNELALEVRGPTGEPLAGFVVELSSAEPFLPRPEPVSSPWRRDPRSGASWWFSWPAHRGYDGRRGSVWGGPPERVHLTTDARGRGSLGELRAGAPLRVAVLDDLGTSLRADELAPLGAEERRVHPLRLDALPGTVRGRVVTESGEPVAGAAIELADPRAGTSTRASTDATGRFAFRRVASAELRLTATRPGFLPHVREPVRPSPGELEPEPELVLVHGAELTVRVQCGDPASLSAARVRARRSADEPWIEGEALALDAFRIAGLAAAAHEVELGVGAGALRQTWRPPQREVWFRVPDEVGTVALSWRLAPELGVHGYWVTLESPGGDAGRTEPLTSSPGGSVRFRQFAGAYELVLFGRRDGVPFELERRPLTVVPGETTSVRIER